MFICMAVTVQHSTSTHWLAALMLLLMHNVSLASAQAGFLSLDCGCPANYTASETGVIWMSDESYIHIGDSANTTLVQVPRNMQTVRYFTSQAKSCYTLNVDTGNRYLIRATFAYGNYDGKNKPPVFQYIIDGTVVENVNATLLVTVEIIVFAALQTLSICVAPLDPDSIPFISSLELRIFAASMYTVVTADTYFKKEYRINFGAVKYSSIRMPLDKYDRIWESDRKVFKRNRSLKNLNTNLSVTTEVMENPPAVVMETAVTTTDTVLQLYLPLYRSSENYSIYLYFAEIENLTQARTFDVIINNMPVKQLNLESEVGYLKTFEYSGVFTSVSGGLVINLTRTGLSNLPPIINAAELYSIVPFNSATYQQDVDAIYAFKNTLKLLQWTGDPCLPYPWDWIACSSDVPHRILAVNLSSMQLEGFIDPAVANLSAMSYLFLDRNMLTRSIPDLSSLEQLQYLHLQDNRLSGHIPESLGTLPDLQQLYLENNDLDGLLPAGLENRTGLDIRVNGNPLLCTSNGTCFVPQPSNTPSFGPKESMRNTMVSSRNILAGALIATSSVLLVACAFIVIWRRIKQNSTANDKFTACHAVKMCSVRKVYLFEPEDITAATNNFSTKIGEGAFGSVYYGKLKNGQEVAVKVNSRTSSQGDSEFFNEVEFLSRVHHRNVVALIGWCASSENKILIYEYMEGGNLEQHIFAYGASSTYHLPWKQRLSIAVDAAKGLLYLHQDCYPSIIHRDIKSCNILLTKDMVAKVADFGLSKLGPGDGFSYVVTDVRGTSGYLDPEYFETKQLTQKSDVYSFGILLLEIISGREPLMSGSSQTHMKLCDWARGLLQEGRILDVVDPAMGRDYNEEAMWRVAEIAMACVEPSSVHRPVMADVLQELRDAQDLEGGRLTAFQQSPSPHWRGNFPHRQSDKMHPQHHYSQPIYSKNAAPKAPLKSRSTT